MARKSNHLPIGIDFGTSTTLVARQSAAELAEVIPLGRSTPWLPSVVGRHGAEPLKVAEDADSLPRQYVVRSAKTGITRGLQSLATPAGADVLVQEAVKAIIDEAISRALEGGVDIRKAPTVQLGCPAMWQASERELLLGIAQDCGLNAELGHIVDEPIAAGVAWIEDRLRLGERLPDTRVLVFDPGGGTLDVALLYVRQAAAGDPEIMVMSSDGVNESGDDLDRALANHLAEAPELAALISRDPVVSDLVTDRARELKELLSTETSVRRPLGGETSYVLECERTDLDRCFGGQWRRAEGLIMSVVRAAKLRERQALSPEKIRSLTWEEVAAEVSFVVLVGGQSQMPMIRDRLGQLFPQAQVNLVSNPQEAVVRGLALADRFERLSLHRPPFSFSVSFYDALQQRVADPQVIYPAFTPLYEPWQVAQMGGLLGFQPKSVKAPTAARHVLLHCNTVDGQDLPLQLDGELLKGIALPVQAWGKTEFKLYVNGDIIFRAGAAVKLRVKSWPTVRGKQHDWKLDILRADADQTDPILIDDWRFVH